MKLFITAVLALMSMPLMADPTAVTEVATSTTLSPCVSFKERTEVWTKMAQVSLDATLRTLTDDEKTWIHTQMTTDYRKALRNRTEASGAAYIAFLDALASDIRKFEAGINGGNWRVAAQQASGIADKFNGVYVRCMGYDRVSPNVSSLDQIDREERLRNQRIDPEYFVDHTGISDRDSYREQRGFGKRVRGLHGRESEGMYVVGYGDVLWKIALAYGLTTEDMCRMNALRDCDELTPGQRLRVR